MSRTILLTSFQTWLPHHISNSSDDLLSKIPKQRIPQELSLTFLRQLPVDTPQASQRVLSAIQILQPDAIVCCGMAETRSQLTIESNAWCGDRQLKTPVDLDTLVAELTATAVSHDAGKFVCEGLYYEVLNYLQRIQSPSRCVFVHVPLLAPHNLPGILDDFLALLLKV